MGLHLSNEMRNIFYGINSVTITNYLWLWSAMIFLVSLVGPWIEGLL